jgi:hypothetical protein
LVTLDELEAELASQQQQVRQALVPLTAVTAGTRQFQLKCQRCTSVWMSLYHGKCLSCNAPREQVDIQWSAPNQEKATTIVLPDESSKLKSDIDPSEPISPIGYLLRTGYATALEITRMRRHEADQYALLLRLVEEEMKEKGLTILPLPDHYKPRS